MKFFSSIILIFIGFCGFSQEQTSIYKTKTVAVKQVILIDSVSINSNQLSITTKNGTRIDSSIYQVDFPKALLTFKQPIASDSIIINYLKFLIF